LAVTGITPPPGLRVKDQRRRRFAVPRIGLSLYKRGMPAYRFYGLTASAPEEMTVGLFYSDGAAMTWGFSRAGASGVEVWQGARFVGRLHGPDAGDRQEPGADS